jgi:hypothetical protein
MTVMWGQCCEKWRLDNIRQGRAVPIAASPASGAGPNRVPGSEGRRAGTPEGVGSRESNGSGGSYTKEGPTELHKGLQGGHPGVSGTLGKVRRRINRARAAMGVAASLVTEVRVVHVDRLAPS